VSAQSRFDRRVLRLAATSVIALGLIFALWAVARPGGTMAGVALGAGWVLMPGLLLLSLKRPLARYALVAPATLVSGGLIAISAANPGSGPIEETGWLLMSAGVLLGGLLGAWFWFRLLPVPRQLEDPFAFGRWALIAVHVGFIVAGISLVAISAL
jgi:hypothetical protein